MVTGVRCIPHNEEGFLTHLSFACVQLGLLQILLGWWQGGGLLLGSSLREQCLPGMAGGVPAWLHLSPSANVFGFMFCRVKYTDKQG